jgi:hypothetical protein
VEIGRMVIMKETEVLGECDTPIAVVYTTNPHMECLKTKLELPW